MNGDSDIRNVSDTALWVAIYRANETDRPDHLFRDKFARKLAGERGQNIFDAVPERSRYSWAYVMRTFLFDRFVTQEIKNGADMVVNLAAGLDTRPYRMALPPALQWIEVDLPDLLKYKESILNEADAKPTCKLERVALDLADVNARRALFKRLGARAKRAVILSEGLLIYLSPDEVSTLARDLAAQPSFQRWIIDMASPGLKKMMEKEFGQRLEAANAPFKFAPAEGPLFFEPAGWHPIDVQSTLKNAARYKRLGLLFSLMAKLPESRGAQGARPWSATVLLGR